MPEKPVVVGVIPSRYASQRLHAKSLVDLAGKSLVQRVYDQAKKASLLDSVVVATDDSRIEEAVRRFGGDVIMTSTDIKSGSDRVAAAALKLKGDIFINIQGDEPLIAPEMIDQAVQLLIDDSAAHVSTLVKIIKSPVELLNANVVKVVMNNKNYALYFSRSIIPFVRDESNTAHWLDKHTFYKHIGLYAFRKEFLIYYSQLPPSNLEEAEKLEQLRILDAGYKIKAGITTFDTISIDTKEDVARVAAILQQTASGL
jgi:3-deoxy-manno-octulosonate cytidylyltransferase (CMP-KDO synthetase)